MEKKTYTQVLKKWIWMFPALALTMVFLYYSIGLFLDPKINRPGGYAILGALFINQFMNDLLKVFKDNNPQSKKIYWLLSCGILLVFVAIMLGGIALVVS